MSKRKYPDYIPDYEEEEIEQQNQREERARNQSRNNSIRQSRNETSEKDTSTRVIQIDSRGQNIADIRLEETSTRRSNFKFHTDRNKHKKTKRSRTDIIRNQN